MKHQWIIRISALAALVAAGVVFARWSPSSDGPDDLSLRADPATRDIGELRRLLSAGRLDDAVAKGESIVAEAPDASGAWWLLGEAYGRRAGEGDEQRSREAFQQVDRLLTEAAERYRSPDRFYRLGFVRRRAGDEERSREAFAQAAAIMRRHIARARDEDGGSDRHYNLACYAALAGQRDEALAAFERAVELGYDDPEHARADTDLDAIRDDPRFVAAMERIRRQDDALTPPIRPAP